MSQHETAHASLIRDAGGPGAAELRLRTLNVEVPEEVYWHVRQCATKSRLSMKEYMAIFCQEAFPYSIESPQDCRPVEPGNTVEKAP